MSESERATLEIGDYHLDSSEQDSSMNGADQGEVPGVQVKFEPDDPDYEPAVGAGNVSAGLIRSFPPQGLASSQSAAQWSGSSSAVRTQMRKMMEDKSVDSNTAAQNVQNVIEDLLKKNEYLLAQNDALGFKPNSRRGRIPGEVGRSKEVVFPSPGQSTTFSTGQLTQGRVSVSNSRNSPQRDQTAAVSIGQLMRPKSPTRRCSIPEKDKSHFNLALMESKVGSEESEKIFHVQEHEMVCAISSQTKFLNKEGRLVSSVDISYYWCNFCPFSTTNKSQLMQHIVEHRFHCKHCRYQSFSRADVIHHSVHTHPQFHETAAITQYCTFLSDYLRIHNPKELSLDHQRKRREPPNDDGSEQPSSKVSKSVKGKVKPQKQHQANYHLYDLDIENLEDTLEEEEGAATPQETGTKSSSASSSLTVVSSQPESQPTPTTSSLTSSLVAESARCHTASPVPDASQPVISQVFSASTIPQALAPEVPVQGSLQRSASSSVRSAPTPTRASPSPTPPVLNPNSVGAGAMQQMRSNLYWSCGYCTFTSKSQSGIKDHSVRQHSGKPHRYVALIRPEESSTPPPSKSGSGEDSNSSADQNLEIDVAEDNGASNDHSVGQSDNPSVDSCQTDEPPVLVKQEPADVEDSIVPIKVRFPTPRMQTKDTTSLKCYHCNYSSRLLGPLRNHILNRHKGKSLIGLGGMNSKVFMCTRSDCTFRSSSGQIFLGHSQECTPWMEGDAQVEGHLVKSLQATTRIAEESQALSPSAAFSSSSTAAPKVRYEKFCCLYCNCQFTSNKKETKQHVLKFHGAQCPVVRNVQAHRKKKRSSVFFCRWCPWEGQRKAEHDVHAVFCQAKWQGDHRKGTDDDDDDGSDPAGRTEDKGEDSDSIVDIVSDTDGDAGLEPPDITQDQLDPFESFDTDRLHVACLTPDSSTAELKSCSADLDSMCKPETKQECNDYDSDGMPELRLSNVTLTDSAAASVSVSSQSTLLTQIRPRLDRQTEDKSIKKEILMKFKAKKASRRKTSVLRHRSVVGGQRLKTKVKHGFCSKGNRSRKWLENKKVTDVQCSKCAYISDSLSLLKIHMQNSHDEGTSFSFRSMYHRVLHLKCMFFACPSLECTVYRYSEADVVQHYNLRHSSQPHPYLDSTYIPAPVKFRQRLNAGGKISQGSTGQIVSKVLLKNEKPYLCLYCDRYYYADTVCQMKAHHLSHHPGQSVIIRDVVAYRNRKPSRLCVCDQALCDFSTYESKVLEEHLASHHSSEQSETVSGGRSFQCALCGWIATNDSLVYEHVSTMHASEGGTTVVMFRHGEDTIEEKYIRV